MTIINVAKWHWTLKSIFVLLVLNLGHTPCLAADASPPSFSGFMSSTSTGLLFAVRWKLDTGDERQALLRLGDQAGSYRLLDFDPEMEVLSVEDRFGRRYRLSLPTGHVRQEQLTEAEYQKLFSYLMEGADVTHAPVLSREKARAFYFEKIRRMFPDLDDVQVIFDIYGSTLPPAGAATWLEDQKKERAAGTILLAVIVDGKTKLYGFPLRPFPMPDQMTRNLTEADWDEIGLLVATNSLKRRALQK